jgi:hypothetical protein
MTSFVRGLLLLVAFFACLGSGAAGNQLIADRICDDGPEHDRAACHARAQAKYVEERQEELAQEQRERDREQAARAEAQAARAEELARERQLDDQRRYLQQRCDTVVSRLLACGKTDAADALRERSYCKAALEASDAHAYARTVCIETNVDCGQIDSCFAFTRTTTAAVR